MANTPKTIKAIKNPFLGTLKPNPLGRLYRFFFPDDTRLKIEASTDVSVDEYGKMHIHRKFFTFRAFANFAIWYVTKNPYEKAKKYLEDVQENPAYAMRFAGAFAVFLLISILDIKNISNVTLIAGAIAYDAQASTTGSTSPITFSHTTSGSNRALVVTTGGLRNPTAASYNSVSMTEAKTVTPFNTSRVECWTLINPTTGTNTVSLTLASDGSTGVGALSFSGAGGFGNTAGSATTSDTTRSNNLTTTRDGSFVVESQWKDNATSITQNSSQTEVFDNNVGGSRHASAYKQITTAGTNSFQFTGAGSASLIGHALVEVYQYVDPEQLQYAGSSYTSGVSSSSVNLSHTVPNDTNRLLIVNIGVHGTSTSVTSVTYNGDSMTLANSQVGDARIYQYYLIAPDVGTANVTVNFSGNADYSIMAINIVGADQTDPIGTTGGGTGSSSSPSHSITTEQADSFVVAGVAWGGRTSGAPSATGTNQTARVAVDDSTNGFEYGSSTQTTTTVGSYTSSWSGGASLAYAHGLIEVKEVNPVVNVTANPTTQVATFSVPTYTPITGSTITPNTQVLTSSIPAYSVNLDMVIGVNVQVATFSIPTYDILTPDALATPNTPSVTFSVPEYAIAFDFAFGVNTQSAEFSVPAYSILQGAGVTPNTQSAEFSIPAYSVGLGSIIEATVQEATFSIPTYTVVPETRTVVSTQEITASIPTYSILLSSTIEVVTQVLTFTMVAVKKVGAVWTKRGRSTNSTWSRTSRNSN